MRGFSIIRALVAICLFVSLTLTSTMSIAQSFQPGKSPGASSAFGVAKIRVVGTDIVSNGSFASGSTGWTLAGAVSVASSKVTFAAGGATNRISQVITAVNGSYYRITFVVADFTVAAPGMTVLAAGPTATVPINSAGTYVIDILAAAGTQLRITDPSGVGSFSITNISMRPVL